MDLSKLIEWIKLSPKHLLPLTLISGLLLFSTKNLLNIFGLYEFVTKFRPFISIIFLLSVALILSSGLYSFIPFIKSYVKSIQERQRFYSRLQILTPGEKEILYGYIYHDSRTQYFEISDGRLTELIANKIIYQSSNYGWPGEWAYNIQPWAWDYLQKHKDEIFSKEDIKRFKKENNISS